MEAHQWQRSETDVAGDGQVARPITTVLMDSKVEDRDLFCSGSDDMT